MPRNMRPCARCGRLRQVGTGSLAEPVCHDCRRELRLGSRPGTGRALAGLKLAALTGIPADPGYYVYEIWSRERCLYVGRVGNNGPGSVRKRLKNHRSNQTWWSEVARVVVATFRSHEEIVAAEASRIADLQPAYNRMLNTAVAWQPDVRDRDKAYQAAYAKKPERIAAEQARDRDWREFNIRAADRKRRWAFARSRRPGPGQAALF